MKRRLVFLISGGAVLLLTTYLTLPFLLKKWLMPPIEKSPLGTFQSEITLEEPSGRPAVHLWTGSLQSVMRGAYKDVTGLAVVGGEAFTGDELIPREKIRERLDRMVSDKEIESVAVFPVKGSRWGDIFPVLDECRKSRVRFVFLAEYESPVPPP